MAVCCQNLSLGALSSCSALSLLVGALFKKLNLFLNKLRMLENNRKNTNFFHLLYLRVNY